MGRVKAFPTILGWEKADTDSTEAMVGLEVGDVVGSKLSHALPISVDIDCIVHLNY